MWWLLREWKINWPWLNLMEFTPLRYIGLLEYICFPSLFSTVLNTWEALKMTHCTESHNIPGFLAVDILTEVLNKSFRSSLPACLPSLPPSLPPFLPFLPFPFLSSSILLSFLQSFPFPIPIQFNQQSELEGHSWHNIDIDELLNQWMVILWVCYINRKCAECS